MKGQTPEIIGATMTSQEIADLVGSRHDNVKRTIETLVSNGVITSPQSEEKPTAGRPATNYVFSGERGKRDSIVVVAQLSPVFTARLVDRWQELEQRVAAPLIAPIADALALAEVAGRALSMSNSSKLGIFQKIERKYGLDGLLPHYAVDAPSDAADGSSRPTSALRTMLQRRNFPVKVQDAYLRLLDLGIVTRLTRPSSRGADKAFWSLTNKGLLYGKNMTSPANPRETQPHFFDSRADELVAMIVGSSQ